MIFPKLQSTGRAVLPVLVVISAMGLGLLCLETPARADSEDGFPHYMHEGLFPSCFSCHEGILEGEGFYSVSPADCAKCHNEEISYEVAWSGPNVETHELTFDHVLHIEALEEGCVPCHQPEGFKERMELIPISFESTCRDCHSLEEHESDDNDCSMCHG